VRVNLYKNDKEAGEPRLFAVPGTFPEFISQAVKKVGINNAKYAYNANGALIDDVTLLREEDSVYVSATEGFFKSGGSKCKMYRIAILGPGGVGKSCLTLRYIRSTFVASYDPTIEDAFRHQTVVDNEACIMEILDTAGQEEFKCLVSQWVENRDGFILVYSIIDRSTFDDINKYHELILDEYENKPTPPIILVGNKCDLADDRTVKTSEGEALAVQWGNTDFLEASAKTAYNIKLPFEKLIRKLREAEPRKPSQGKKRGCLIL